MTYSLYATAKIMTYSPYYYKNSNATNVCSGNTLPILYGLAINKVTNSIAYPPNHLGGLDSSSRISNDSDVASERFRGVLYPDLGKSSRKRSSFLKNIFTRKKGAPLTPATSPLSNGQKNCEKIYSM